MEQKGLTKNQFRIQLGYIVFWKLFSAYWIVSGILEHRTFKWIMGAILCILYLVYGIYLIVQRKRYPVDDPQLDKRTGDNFKAGMSGMGIFLALITAGFLIAIGIVAACGGLENQRTPYGYVKSSLRTIDKYALYADADWSIERRTYLSEAKTIDNFDDAHKIVKSALAFAGGKHSTLLAPVTDTTTYEELAPEAYLLEGGIAYVKLPAHRGVKVSDSLYTHTVLDYLQSHLDATGVVLDLRDNSGGNMYPMISAVAPLLPDGILLSFKTRKRSSPIPLDYVVRSSGLNPGDISKFPDNTPVAILINGMTGSSGEATLLCFRGLEKSRTFGIPTAGYASANQTIPMDDGYLLVITTGCDVARTGEVFCDDPISPDVETETPLEDAVAWIQGR